MLNDRRSSWYDMFNALLLVCLALLLLPGWSLQGNFSLPENLSLLTSPMLPASLGFLLVLRCRAVDLSIWISMGAGGLAAAGVLLAGGDNPSPSLALLAAIVAGGLIGLLNALLVRYAKLAPWVATLLVAVAIWAALNYSSLPRNIMLDDNRFDTWVTKITYIVERIYHLFEKQAQSGIDARGIEGYGPLLTLRMLLVTGAWSVTMLAMLLSDMTVVRRGKILTARSRLLVALVASGVLSGFSGFCWLMESGQTPLPSRLIDDLVIPAAALMSGGMFLRGRGRTMLAGICLPMAMLVTTLWRQLVWPTQVMGFSRQMFLLVAMLLEVQIAFIWVFDGPDETKNKKIGACALSAIGLLTLAATSSFAFGGNWLSYLIGTGVWAVGTLWMIGQMTRAEKEGYVPPTDTEPPLF
jgi:ribose/xylose/arabinose/galactoside ABC-type transport system permease subunit